MSDGNRSPTPEPSGVQVDSGAVRALQVIVTLAPEGRGRNLNLFLVNAGFAPDMLTQTTQDLEQVFLSLTNSGTGEIQ